MRITRTKFFQKMEKIIDSCQKKCRQNQKINFGCAKQEIFQKNLIFNLFFCYSHKSGIIFDKLLLNFKSKIEHVPTRKKLSGSFFSVVNKVFWGKRKMEWKTNDCKVFEFVCPIFFEKQKLFDSLRFWTNWKKNFFCAGFLVKGMDKIN